MTSYSRDARPTRPDAAPPLDWAADEAAMLQLYGLSTLAPDEWEQGEAGLFSSPVESGGRAQGARGDENDPLGLMRGGVLA